MSSQELRRPDPGTSSSCPRVGWAEVAARLNQGDVVNVGDLDYNRFRAYSRFKA